ncbi:MAG TPA: prolyl oligopeptidase family serine peptidase [Fimbriimonadaceae bacterium]|nr:prolyl oligopeptidase family serine peptidase [Fimbriimonadaceae bacterium]
MNLVAMVFVGVLGVSTAPLEREVSELTYKSVDGRETKAVLSVPKGQGPYPLIVTVHGGNSEKPYGYLRTMAAPNRVSSIVNDLNQQPWAILAVSYRNGFMNLGDDDVIAGVRFGMSLPRIDRSRVALIGGSHGGYKVLQAAIRMGKEIRCVSAGSPWMVDPVTFMKADATQPPFSIMEPGVRDRLTAQGKALMNQVVRREGSEAKAQEFLRSKSALEQSAKIQVPLLLLTSRADESVPHALVEPLYLRMKRQGQPVEIFTVEKSPHGFYWGRVEGVRAASSAKTPEQLTEERKTSEKIITFVNSHLQ